MKRSSVSRNEKSINSEKDSAHLIPHPFFRSTSISKSLFILGVGVSVENKSHSVITLR